MSKEVMIGMLKVANNGDDLLQILDSLIDNEQEDDSWFTDPNSKASYHHY